MRTYTDVSPCFDPLCLADRCFLYQIHTTSIYIYITQHKTQLLHHILNILLDICEKLRKR
ncbi:hypothetical protein HanPSC8_Chr03g0087501 [Helianthus annuus]|nr:hypothetical protein HanPSC8_Chr03g0087501 [Helianthus annuus]